MRVHDSLNCIQSANGPNQETGGKPCSPRLSLLQARPWADVTIGTTEVPEGWRMKRRDFLHLAVAAAGGHAGTAPVCHRPAGGPDRRQQPHSDSHHRLRRAGTRGDARMDRARRHNVRRRLRCGQGPHRCHRRGAGDRRPHSSGVRGLSPFALATRQHVRNFLDSVKSRQKPNCDMEAGFAATLPCLLANVAIREDRTVKWGGNRAT